MYYYYLVPRRSKPLQEIKNTIYTYSKISFVQGIIFFLAVMFIRPWPSDFNDPGFQCLLYIMAYLLITNLATFVFVYEEHTETSNDDDEFGECFDLCFIIRHLLFIVFLCLQKFVIYDIAISKLYTAYIYGIEELLFRRIAFFLWSIFFLCVEVLWFIETCKYQQIIYEKNSPELNDSDEKSESSAKGNNSEKDESSAITKI